MDQLEICPNCGRQVGSASVCAACGYVIGQAAIHTSYPKLYRIPQTTTKTVSIVYAVLGLAASVYLGVTFYRSGAAPGLIAGLVAAMLVATGLAAWFTSIQDKTTSITLYEDHVEWKEGQKTGSCSNHELTIMFGTRPHQSYVGSQSDIRLGRKGGPYMWAWRDFESYDELVAELQRRARQ